MAKKLQAKIEQQANEIAEKDLKIQNLNDALKNEKTSSDNALIAKDAEWKQKDIAKDGQHKIEIDGLDLKVSSLQDSLKEKQEELDLMGTKKLAVSFETQEGIYKRDQRFWLIGVASAALALLVYTVVSICLTSGTTWSDRVGYYAIEIILISVVWFCSAQFSEAKDLRHDYGNRKTLAQSFHNILNNLAEDGVIKLKFIEKTTDILCAPVGGDAREPILTKKALKDMAEILKSVKGG
jgi:hypothetical protein